MTAGPDLAKRRTAGWGDQHERGDELEPTHEIRTPPDATTEVAAPSANWLIQRVERCRFWYQPVGSLQDHLRYGRDAAISIVEKGPWRTTNIVFTKITAPFLVLAFFVIHAFLRRPARCAWWTLGVLVAAPILHGIPVIGWLPPVAWFDATTWFAGPDLAQCGIDAVGGE